MPDLKTELTILAAPVSLFRTRCELNSHSGNALRNYESCANDDEEVTHTATQEGNAPAVD